MFTDIVRVPFEPFSNDMLIVPLAKVVSAVSLFLLLLRYSNVPFSTVVVGFEFVAIPDVYLENPVTLAKSPSAVIE